MLHLLFYSFVRSYWRHGIRSDLIFALVRWSCDIVITVGITVLRSKHFAITSVCELVTRKYGGTHFIAIYSLGALV